jgi:tetratricopeptide (TPR) repeat protein
VASACPGSAERHLQAGHQHARKQAWQKAVEAYEAAAAADATCARCLSLAGLANQRLGRPEAAADAFSRALAIDRAEAGAHVGLGALAVEAADAGAALTWLEAVTTPEAEVVRGRALLLRGGPGDADAALTSARAALAALPASVEARYLEGSALLALTRYAEAQASFETLERTARDSPFGPYGLARVAAAQQRSTDVLLYLKAARAAAPQAWQARAVAADPAFAFLAGSPAFTDAVGP